MSIRRKLSLTIVGISLAAVILTVSAITAYLIYDMTSGTRQELSVTAAITGDRNAAAISFLDSERAASNLEIFRLNPSILAACLYDKSGGLFAFYNAQGSSLCPRQAGGIIPAMPEMLTAMQRIMQNGEQAGTVYMVSDMRQIDNYVRKILLISFTVTLVVIAVTLLLTFYFQRTITGPILELAATAQAITARHDYSIEAKSNYGDETGILAQALNEMLGAVRARDEELRHANETLEEKVQIRTRQLEEEKQKAEAANEAKSEFLRNMSHELRTPLHAIISFSSYGIKEYADAEREQTKQYFQIIQKGAERLSRLVNEVLDLAKLEQGQKRLLMRKGDVGELVSRAVEMVKPLLAEKQITLSFEQPPEGISAVCDHDKIVQVITNLLGNAIKFTHNGRNITIKSKALEDGMVKVSVIDQGIGIPEAEKESIFESFRQSSRTNTGAGGTGLGLAICRGIIEAHGGKIWAANNEHIGARVSFIIPVKQKITAIQSLKEAEHEHAA